MIDTVCLSIPERNIILMDENNNMIPNWNLYSRTEHYTKHVRNPSKSEKDTGLYFPRITAYSRKYQPEQQIKIEFSAPKLLFLNNLDELADKDFDQVIDTLQDRLRRMGVTIFKKYLIEAPVTSVHYSRNIMLSGGQTSTNILSQIGRIDLRKSFDFARARYINDGQSLCCHTSSHELVFYDKIADLNKGKKRAIDRDRTAYQTSLFDELKNRNDAREVLRMEVRLSKKQKMNSVFRQLKLTQNPCFKDIFSSKISNEVLMTYWNNIVKSKNLASFMLELSPIELLKRISANKPSTKPKQLIFLTGIILMAQSSNGLRELREVICKKADTRTWSRLICEYRSISEIVSAGRLRNWVKDLEYQINNYKPLRINK